MSPAVMAKPVGSIQLLSTPLRRPSQSETISPAAKGKPTDNVATPTATPTATPSRPVSSPALRTPCAANGASDLYRARLYALITEAHTAALSLRLSSPEIPVPHMGARGQVAFHLQGRVPSSFEAILPTLPAETPVEDYKALLDAGAAGHFEDYGVPEAHAEWLMHLLRESGESATAPPADDPVAWARLRLFEAEVACLPVACVDGLLAARKLMRKMRTRIDTCVRILLAMEGRGRRVSQATLDKLKATLEKAERQAQVEQEKLRKAQDKERKSQERERAKLERELKGELAAATAGAGGPAADAGANGSANGSSSGGASAPGNSSTVKRSALEEKRRREKMQRDKQASFMKRFIRPKTSNPDMRAGNGTASITPNDSGQPRDGGDNGPQSTSSVPKGDQVFREQGALAADFASDRDVMPVCWWIRAQMESTSFKDMDLAFALRSEDGESAARQYTNVGTRADLQAHMVACAKRRVVAEGKVRSAMRDFRRSRKEHAGDRNPRFVRRRSDSRCQCNGQTVKLYQFAEDHRPAYYGTKHARSTKAGGRRPFAKDMLVDYDYDSEDDWDDDEDGEDLSDIEADLERANENAELVELYGDCATDEEEDDDFFDEGADGEEEDENEDDDEVEAGDDDDTTNAGKSVGNQVSQGESIAVQEGSGKSVSAKTSSCVATDKADEQSGSKTTPIDKEKEVIVVLESGDTTSTGKRSAKGDMNRRGNKRRKTGMRQNVTIEGPSPPRPGKASALDRYSVSIRAGMEAIPMYNPYVLSVSDLSAENLRTRTTPVKTGRVTMTDVMRKELARTIAKWCQVGVNRDKLVGEFCQACKASGLDLPSRSEIVRAIGEMARFEKRKGDSRACWYLNDGVLDGDAFVRA